MKFGVLMLNWEPFSYNPKLYFEAATTAEKLDFDSFFVTDHFMRPKGADSLKAHSTIEAWSLLSFLAASTSTIRLGTCVTPVPLRPPAQLAKTIATLDVLSNGRVILGAGAGWDQGEFDAYGSWDSPAVRVDRTREGLALITRLWTEDQVNFTGRFYKAANAVLEPKPIQKPHPPIWIGSYGLAPRMIRVASDLAQGWFPAVSMGATTDIYGSGHRMILDRLKMRERDQKFTFALLGYFKTPGSLTALPALGTIDEAVSKIETYEEEGCEYFVAMFFPQDNYLMLMKKFAVEVVPSF